VLDHVRLKAKLKWMINSRWYTDEEIDERAAYLVDLRPNTKSPSSGDDE
jgi:hypothetical protein